MPLILLKKYVNIKKENIKKENVFEKRKSISVPYGL